MKDDTKNTAKGFGKRNKLVIFALTAVLAMAMLVLASCSCSAEQSSSAASSGSASAAAVSSQASASSAQQSASQQAVPNVVSQSVDDAKKSLAAAGFEVGEVKNEPSDTVAAGSVISQNPQAGAQAEKGAKVSLVVSTGKAADSVKVPDVRNMTREQAEAALKNAGLEGVFEGEVETLKVKQGLVCRQSAEPGSSLRKGDKVLFAIAKVPSKVSVPNLTEKTEDEAITLAGKYSLNVESSTEHSSKVPKGHVVSQSPAAGAEVQGGSTVKITVSSGPEKKASTKKKEKKEQATPQEPTPQPTPQQPEQKQQVKVPDVVGLSWDKAQDVLESAGLSARCKGDEDGTVKKQDIAPGTRVDEGTTVTVTTVKMVEVPDLEGKTVISALDTLQDIGLDINRDGIGQRDIIVSQKPKAGEVVEVGTKITVKVEDNPDFH